MHPLLTTVHLTTWEPIYEFRRMYEVQMCTHVASSPIYYICKQNEIAKYLDLK